MSRILFLLDIELDNPRRGTPLHICATFRELKKEHVLRICAASVPEEFKDDFIPYPRVRGLLKLLALRRIIKENNITHVYTVSMSGLLAPVILKYLCGIRIAMELHGVNYDELLAAKWVSIFRYYYMKYKVRALLHLYDTVFVMSTRLRDKFLPMSRHWTLLHGGVDMSEVVDATSNPSKDAFIVGYMGNSREYQGLPYLIEACAIARANGVPMALNFVISGDVSKIRSLLVEKNLLEITKLHHDVSHAEAYRLIANSSVLVLPRADDPVTRYAFPGKLAEYLATGIPTIATQIGPIDEMRDDFSRVALLVPPVNIPEALAAAIDRLYCMSPTERNALGVRAREFARKTFTWEERGKVMNAQFR
jgi:glycosyltransferase involved in cell wall biosynthesis